MAPRRIQLGHEFRAAHRSYAWLLADAVEVDDVDGYDVARRRVLLDEVLLVTLHRGRRAGLLLALLIAALFFTLPVAALPSGRAAFYTFLIMGSPFLLGFFGHLLLGTDYVTVFGRRSQARVAFNFRKARARQVFELLTRAVRSAEVVEAEARPAQEGHAVAGVDAGLQLVGLSLGDRAGLERGVDLVERRRLARVLQLLGRDAEPAGEVVEERGGRERRPAAGGRDRCAAGSGADYRGGRDRGALLGPQLAHCESFPRPGQ